MANQFDLNKFNSFIDSATKAIACDADCQRNKTSQELKDKYLNAQANITLAEPEFQIAKKNYYTYVSGVNGYNEMIEKELTKKAQGIANNLKNTLETEKTKLQQQINTYEGQLITYRNMLDLYKKYKMENEELTNELKNITNDVLTNDRKTYYEDQQNDVLNGYYYYFFIIIYLIIVACFGIFSLTYPSIYSWKAKAFLFLLFLLIPLVSTWILGKIIQIIYFLFNLLPKNVYK